MAIEGCLLVIGEEALDDEILFAHALPALADGQAELILAIRPEWRRLAEHSFPGAKVVAQLRRRRYDRPQLTAELESPHVHAKALVGAWTTLRSLLKAYRATAGDFPSTPYLKADPRRVEHWQGWLAGLGPGRKVGVRWRSEETDYRARRQTPPLAALRQVLALPGLCLVALQEVEEPPGLPVHRPPDLDRSDLDDVAALSQALDLVVGGPDPVTYAAAACGAETWFLAPPGHWALLGQETYPWFPGARVFASPAFNDWEPAVSALAGALAATAAG
jgi:hypothetical protein